MGDKVVYTKETFMEQVRKDLRKKELKKRNEYYKARQEYFCNEACARIITKVTENKINAYKRSQTSLSKGSYSS